MSTRLKKTEQYAIMYMLEHNKNDSEIIKELKISQAVLDKFKEKHLRPNNENNVKTTTSNTSKAKDLMITKTSVKNNSGVSIMTKEASQVGDTFLQNMPTKNRNESVIHRPNNG
jgi:hypothetical protein